MIRTLLILAAACALVWACVRGWNAYHDLPPHSRARWCMERADFDAALPLLEQAAYDDPNNMEIALDMAECYDRKGNKAMAGKLYRQAQPLFTAPDAPPAMEYHRDRFAMLVSIGY